MCDFCLRDKEERKRHHQLFKKIHRFTCDPLCVNPLCDQGPLVPFVMGDVEVGMAGASRYLGKVNLAITLNFAGATQCVEPILVMAFSTLASSCEVQTKRQTENYCLHKFCITSCSRQRSLELSEGRGDRQGGGKCILSLCLSVSLSLERVFLNIYIYVFKPFQAL